MFFSACIYSPHYVCEYISEEKLYSKSINGDIFSKDFSKYTVEDKVFVLTPEMTLCHSKSKNTSEARIALNVYAQTDSYKYTVKKINLELDDKEYDVKEFVTKYYPYDSDSYIPFTKCPVIEYYYWSHYHLGFITFPTPNNKNIKINVIVVDENGVQYTFTYSYLLKMTFDLFVSTV